MTREEAIKKLERKLSNMKIVDSAFADCVDGEALEMAVKALKEEPERKKGKWIDARDYCGEFLCSNCHETNINNAYKYCPHCGARMEVGNDA